MSFSGPRRWSESFTSASSACCSHHVDCCFFPRVSYCPPFVASEPWRFRFLMSRLPSAWGSLSDLADSVVTAGPRAPHSVSRGCLSSFLTWLVSKKLTSNGPENTLSSKQRKRCETGTQPAGTGDRQEDRDRNRRKKAANEAATE